MAEKKKRAPRKRAPRKKAAKKPIDTKKCYALVANLIKKNGKTSMSMQIKSANKLLELYDYAFLKYVCSMESEKYDKPYTLTFYLSDKGKQKLNYYKRMYENHLELSKEKDNPLTFSEKPLYYSKEPKKRGSVMDFLKEN